MWKEQRSNTEQDLHNRLNRAFEKPNANGICTYGYMWMLFPAENVAWFKEYGRKSELDLVEIKYTVANDEVTITEKNPVTLTVSPREINQVVAQKDNAIIEMSAQIQSLNETVAQLKPYKDKVDEIEKAEKEAQFEKDKKELSDYALSSGHITSEELETSEEIKGYIETFLPYVKTSYSEAELVSLATKAVVGGWVHFQTEQYVVPDEASRKAHSGDVWYWEVDYPLAAQTMQNNIYGKTNIVLNENRNR